MVGRNAGDRKRHRLCGQGEAGISRHAAAARHDVVSAGPAGINLRHRIGLHRHFGSRVELPQRRRPAIANKKVIHRQITAAVQLEAQRLAPAVIDAVEQGLPLAQCAGDAAAQRQFRYRNVDAANRNAEVVCLIGLGQHIANVAAQDDAIAALRNVRQQDVQAARIAVTHGDIAIMIHPAQQPVTQIPTVIGGEIERIRPRPLRGRTAQVAHGKADRGGGPHHGGCRHVHGLHGKVGRWRQGQLDPARRRDVVREGGLPHRWTGIHE